MRRWLPTGCVPQVLHEPRGEEGGKLIGLKEPMVDCPSELIGSTTRASPPAALLSHLKTVTVATWPPRPELCLGRRPDCHSPPLTLTLTRAPPSPSPSGVSCLHAGLEARHSPRPP